MPFKEDAALLKTKLADTKKFWDDVGDNDLSPEQKSQIDSLNNEVADLSARVAESKEYQRIREQQEIDAKALDTPVDRPEFANTDPRNNTKTKSIGEQFINRPEFKQWWNQMAPSGTLGESGPIGNSCPPMSVEGKALVTGLSTTSAGALTRREYAPLVDFPFRPLTLRDVVTVGRVGTDLIEFPRVVSYTNNAAPVAESTTTPTSFNQAGNGLKPESSMVLEKVAATVKTIAHWIPVTRRAMADAAQIETLINNFLDTGLEMELEEQMIQGNGSGENFLGLDNTPNITLQAFDTDIITTARKARTKAVTVGRARSTAFVMHPNDWEDFDLFKDGENRFYFGGPIAMGTRTLWGLPVVESEAVLEGTFYTGDLKQAILWDREQANIRVSDAPNDFFLRNMLAILAELRAAFGVFRPPAIVRGDLHSGPNS